MPRNLNEIIRSEIWLQASTVPARQLLERLKEREGGDIVAFPVYVGGEWGRTQIRRQQKKPGPHPIYVYF
jgi:hypothetical protein